MLSVLWSQQGISVYASVDKKNITLDEQITLKLTIAGVGFFPPQDLPEIKGFSVWQTGQHTGVDFSTGKSIPYTVYEYFLSPSQEGAYTIPPIYVRYKGYYYTSKAIDVKVAGYKPIAESAPLASAPQSVVKRAGAPVFVTSSISRTKALYNQQLIYTYTIFTRVPLRKIPTIVFPDYEAFHREPLDYRRIYTTRIRGTLYKAVEMKCALFPFMTDEQQVPGVKMKCGQDCFVKQKQKVLIKRSKSLSVHVSALPLKDKPLDFSGLIGKFDIITEVDSSTVAIDGMLVFTVRVKGEGNISAIPDITAPLMDKLREYDTQTFLNYDKRKNRLSGEKLFRMLLIPTDIGEDTIPSMGFSYFDEEKKTYITRWTEPIAITITKSEKKAVEKDNKDTEKNDNYLPYYLGSAGFLVVLIFLIVIRKRKR